MSAYDFTNLKKIENFKKINRKLNFSSRNKIRKEISENINKTFNANKDNFLNFRKTMSSWKKNDFEKLCNKVMKNKENIHKKSSNWNDEKKGLNNRRIVSQNLKRQNSLFNAIINPNDDSIYPQYYLPRSGSMLLIKKDQNIKGNKRHKKKKLLN